MVSNELLVLGSDRDSIKDVSSFLSTMDSQLSFSVALSDDEALNKFEEIDPDLVLSCHDSSDFSVLRVLEEIREIDQDVSFVIYSEVEDSDFIRDVLNKGADKYVIKGEEDSLKDLLGAVRNELERVNSPSPEKILFRGLFENNDESIVVVNQQGKIIEANSNFKELFNYQDVGLKGESLDDLILPNGKRNSDDRLTSKPLKGELVESETVRETKTGENLQVRVLGYPIKLDGEVIGGFGIYKPLHQNREEEIPLEEYEDILDNTFDLIGVLDDEGKILFVNQSFSEVTGFDREKMEGDKLIDYYHESNWVQVKNEYKKILEKKRKTVRFEGRLRSSDGSYIPTITRFQPLKVNENSSRFLTVIKDISEIKRKEGEIRKKEKRLELALKGADLGIWDWNLENGHLHFDDRWLKKMGYDPENIEKSSNKWADLIHPNDLENVAKHLREHLERDKPFYESEYRIKTASNNWRWVLSCGKVMKRDKEGNPKRITGIHQDIDDKKRTEIELKKREKKYRTITENSYDMISIINTEFKPEFVNKAHKEVLGYELEDLKNENIINYFHPEDQQKVKNILREEMKSQKNGETIQGRFKDNEGNYRWLESNISIIKSEGNKFLVVSRDITDRKKVKKKLRKSKEKYRKILDSSPNAISILDTNGNVVDCNQSALEMHGFESKEEMIGRNPVEHATNDEEKQKIKKKMRKCIEQDGIENLEYSFENQKGTELTVLLSISVLKDFKDEPNGYIVVKRNITQRIKSKEREKFLHSMLRHDLKNRFNLAEGYLDLLSETELSDQQRKIFKKLNKVNQRNKRMVKKVRNLHKLEDFEKNQKIDLDKTIKEVIKEKKHLAKEKNIEIQYEGEKVNLIGNKLLKELFSNLLLNGIEHSNGNLIRIYLRKEEKINIIIEDDGKGVPNYLKNDIFERGTKGGDNAGSGLGLYIVKRLTEMYNGTIEVKKSELGGAKFVIEMEAEN